MPLGEKVRRLRSQRKWSQQELSRRSKVRQPLISRIESQADAGVSVDVLKKLALTLGCSADYLIGMYETDPAEEEVADGVDAA